MDSFSSYNDYKAQLFKREQQILQKLTTETIFKKFFLEVANLADKKCSEECEYNKIIDEEIVKNVKSKKLKLKNENSCFEACVTKIFNSSVQAINSLDKNVKL